MDRDGRVRQRQCAHGLLIVTPSQFAKGDRLKIKVHAGGVGLDVTGRITRVDENPISSPELWRYRLGVELEEALPLSLVDTGVQRVAAKA